MTCEKCKQNPASYRVEQPHNSQKKYVYLCNECSEDIEMSLFIEKLFNELLGKIHAVPLSHLGQFLQEKERPSGTPKMTCVQCGITFDDLKNGSNLGCATCYKSFYSILEPLLKNVHGSTNHEGRIPKRAGASIKRDRQVDILRGHMKQAVEEEDFSRAAFLRDQIKRVQHEVINESDEVR